ncbi:MAG TPA: SOS response-associated peptidase [Acidimicrobiales bacterium]|nr:SOS response-associated peptidase [Acidimicrobiales bacterium]
MCGRYTSTSTIADLASVFEVDEVRTEPLPLRWNVAPSVPVYAVALSKKDPEKGPHRVLGTFRWGLVPSWAKDPKTGNKMINARAEGIVSKPSYRAAIARRRCLIPADEFYEWQRRTASDGRPAGKLPYAFRRRDGAPMALAGIWEVWRDPSDPDAELLRTCAIITTGANELMEPIHDRMPVVLESSDWEAWLDPGTGMEVVEGLMVPAAPSILEAWPVSSQVNKVTNEGPQLLDRLPDPPGA